MVDCEAAHPLLWDFCTTSAVVHEMRSSWDRPKQGELKVTGECVARYIAGTILAS